ncbi:PREDICTED: uncharacterized protein LOC106121132 [Papilio xuthus]|uniref:Uncharacterized protein LOC106121132 n=1 Tax=Papilio xuthus TaxID=66420 RepID=A0AAJ6ZGL4_PAPXU|nr:PREDICTED: uncharacterized protein LOC106121132 [Papilio xuthus]
MFKLVVLSSVLALVAANPSGLAPWGAWGHGWGLGLAAPLLGAAHGALAAPVAAPIPIAPAGLRAYNYRGPISLAPGQPANILATDGRPLDTLSVNLDRSAHLTARALEHAGGHLLRKRSAPLLAAAPLAAAWSHSARLDIPAARLIAPAPLALSAAGHLGWGAPLAPWGLGALGHGLPLAHG